MEKSQQTDGGVWEHYPKLNRHTICGCILQRKAS